MLNHTTHPQGRDSHNLNKYIWRFIALSTAQPRVIHIEAASEQEARQQSPAGCVMVFTARIRQGNTMRDERFILLEQKFSEAPKMKLMLFCISRIC